MATQAAKPDVTTAAAAEAQQHGATPSEPTVGQPPPAAAEPQSDTADAAVAAPSDAPGARTPNTGAGRAAVRFSSRLQEIEPARSVPLTESDTPEQAERPTPLSPEAQADLRNLSLSLQNSGLQEGRMRNFQFEAISLPPSRVPSRENLRASDSPSAPPGAMAEAQRAAGGQRGFARTPPLTPADSSGREDASKSADPLSPAQQITPQVSDGSRAEPPTAGSAESLPAAAGHTRETSTQSSGASSSGSGLAMAEAPAAAAAAPRPTEQQQSVRFSMGAGASGSRSPSREPSPARTPRSGGSGRSTPPTQQLWSRPLPVGDPDDPYARHRRRPDRSGGGRHPQKVDERFQFEGGNRDSSRRASGFFAGLGGGSGADLPEKGRAGGAAAADRGSDASEETVRPKVAEKAKKGSSSMANLKRFFKIGDKRGSRASSPAKRGPGGGAARNSTVGGPGARGAAGGGSGSGGRPLSMAQMPFADDHGLESRWGKFGRVLGAGAGGSVRLMRRGNDGVTFAVKQFRARHAHETEREYAKKVTAEFCVGSTLHHGNIIETLDIVQEGGRWFEVMEYAPYDLFTIVMTGRMSREEIACCFKQIVTGVTYLHSMGLAHRDLKLDNVVVSDRGIMKLIDFGSATVFRYPFETDIVLATGVVGSDPYLAPEVYEVSRYDPQPTDVWSLGIIFACMMLRRFPWKVPRPTDPSFKQYCNPPTPGTPAVNGAELRRHWEASARAAREQREAQARAAGAAGPRALPPSRAAELPHRQSSGGQSLAAIAEQEAQQAAEAAGAAAAAEAVQAGAAEGEDGGPESRSTTGGTSHTANTDGDGASARSGHRNHHHHHHHRHQHHHRSGGGGERSDSTASTLVGGQHDEGRPASNGAGNGANTAAPDDDSSLSSGTVARYNAATVQGPWRLLRLLPRDARPLLGLMLEPDPAQRATLPMLAEDAWLLGVAACRQEADAGGSGRVHAAPGHSHTLEAAKEPELELKSPWVA